MDWNRLRNRWRNIDCEQRTALAMGLVAVFNVEPVHGRICSIDRGIRAYAAQRMFCRHQLLGAGSSLASSCQEQLRARATFKGNLIRGFPKPILG